MVGTLACGGFGLRHGACSQHVPPVAYAAPPEWICACWPTDYLTMASFQNCCMLDVPPIEHQLTSHRPPSISRTFMGVFILLGSARLNIGEWSCHRLADGREVSGRCISRNISYKLASSSKTAVSRDTSIESSSALHHHCFLFSLSIATSITAATTTAAAAATANATAAAAATTTITTTTTTDVGSALYE